MASKSISPNHREILSAQSTITGQQEYVTSTNGALNISGSSGGGGTQYTDGSVTIAHPIGTIPVYDNGGTIASISTTNRLPVSATQSGTWNITNVSGTVSLPTGAATGAKQDTGNTSLSSIATNTTGLALDATLTGGTQQTKLTDGTNIASILKSDGTAAGQNAQLIAPTGLSVAFTTTTVQAVGTTDCFNYAAVSVQLTSHGTSSTVTFQVSNDNTNWVSLSLAPSTAVAGTNLTLTSTTTGIWFGAIQARYFRLNVTGISAGTTAGTITFSTTPKASAFAAISNPSVTQSGTWTVQPGNTANTTAWKVDGSAVTQPVSLTSTTVTGTVAVTESGTWTVQPGNTANSTPWLVTDTAATSGGLSIITGSVGATATAIKASAGQLYGYHLFNTTAAVAYVQIFNVAAASVTLGTTAPTFSIGIPASGGVTVNFDKGIAFSTAISFGCTTTRTGLTGATCDVNFFYK